MASRSSRSSHGGKPFSANRIAVTPAKMSGARQKYPEIKQRGFYSDIIGSDAADGRLGVKPFNIIFFLLKLRVVSS